MAFDENFKKLPRVFIFIGQQRCTMVGRLASGPSCPRFDSQRSQKNSEEKIIDVVKVNPMVSMTVFLADLVGQNQSQSSGSIIFLLSAKKTMMVVFSVKGVGVH